jgi:hypothetical protein
MTKYKGSILFLGLVFLTTGALFAAAAVRGAKGHKVITQSTAATPIHTGAVVVYSVILGTGAVTDYVVLLDSANATAAVVANQSDASYKGRFYAASTSANTNITFDPPLQLKNGLTAINSTAVMTSGISYEPGKVVQGY